MRPRPFRTSALAVAVSAAACATLVAVGGGAQAGSTPAAGRTGSAFFDCPPSARALGYSDALDKLEADGAEVGGLSAMAYDARSRSYAAIEDHSTGQATRIWFLRDVTEPTAAVRVVGTMTLTAPDGTPYDDTNFDAEGMAVLPNGDFLVSSEVEPSIHEFDRQGREVGTLPVPARFRAAPAGEATDNATLEGLTISPDGRTVYAAMEGTLSGDVSSAGVADFRRILVYERDRHGYRLTRQIGYRVQPGNRISEAQAYGRDGLLIMEAAWSADVGNTVELYAVHTSRTADVSRVGDLGDHPRLVARKTLVTDVTKCPSLGATAKETQENPLMDNFEAMAIRQAPSPGPSRGRTHGERGLAEVMLLSDDNFGDTQTTRLLRLAARLP